MNRSTATASPGAEQGLAGDLNSVLRATGNRDPVRVGFQTVVLEDESPGFAMRLEPFRRYEPVQPVDPHRARHPRQPVGKTRVEMRIGKVSRQIAGFRLVFLRGKGRNLLGFRGNIGAPSGFSLHQPAPLGFAVGTGNGAERHAKLIGEFTLRRQPVTLGKRPGLDVGFQRVRDRQIDRATGRFDVRDPHCHENNVIID